MWKFLLLLGCAGALGTICRYLGTRFLLELLPRHLPFATLSVNMIGSFLAGFLFLFLKDRAVGLEAYAPVILVGFLGAFTTFSTYSLETMVLFSQGELIKACTNILLQNVCGLLCAYAGLSFARIFS